jgi:hypothetical protein
MPDWYALLRAAKYLGVTPWELAEKPICWLQWALTAETAENQAERQRSQRKT